jgi:hypothetical protein
MEGHSIKAIKKFLHQLSCKHHFITIYENDEVEIEKPYKFCIRCDKRKRLN